ncbi:hypothetical protein [Streptomyces goshikiensis]|uniref:hypothetical protein n=1 Tax=Streptomyces goshikiensis TaxID=1942 RepID=UPI0036989DD1
MSQPSSPAATAMMAAGAASGFSPCCMMLHRSPGAGVRHPTQGLAELLEDVALVLLPALDVHHQVLVDLPGEQPARGLNIGLMPTAERRARAWTDTARMWHALGNGQEAFAALRLVEQEAAQEVRRPALRALTSNLFYSPARVQGLREFAVRTGAVPAQAARCRPGVEVLVRCTVTVPERTMPEARPSRPVR